MKNSVWFVGALALVACGLIALPFLGCESSSKSSGDFNITPQEVTLVASNTPAQTFVASGGTEPYAWSLDDSTLGTLDKPMGTQVVYTATTNIGNNVLRAIDYVGGTSTAVIKQE